MSATTLVFAVAFMAIVALIVVGVVFFYRFNRATRNIVELLKNAENWRDYEQRYRELCCHYLCLIPFVGRKTALHLYEIFFYKAKHKAHLHRTDGLWHILFPSIAGMCLCVLCLCSTTFAWFTATKSQNIGAITTATYDITVVAECDGSTLDVPKNSENCYNITLAPNTEYVITLSATGTAQKGFCTVFDGTALWHTDYILSGDSITFNVRKNTAQSVTICPKWGEIAISDGTTLSEDTLVDPAPTAPASIAENTENTQSQATATTSQNTESTASKVTTSESDNTASVNIATSENNTTSVITDSENTVTNSTD